MRHLIICTGLDGYRRAGLVLAQGKNLVDADFTAEQLGELRGDARTVLVERDILPAELVAEIKAEMLDEFLSSELEPIFRRQVILGATREMLAADLVTALVAEGRAEAEAEAKAKADALELQLAVAKNEVLAITGKLAEAEARAAATQPEATEAPPADKPTTRRKGA